MNIQSTLISAIAAFIFGFAASYKYQYHKYETMIAINTSNQAKAVAVANASALDAERRYTVLSMDNQKLIEERANDLRKVTATSRAVVSSRGLYVNAVCEKRLPPTAKPSGPVASEAASVRLSDSTAGQLESEAERADQAAAIAQAGHDYAVLMQKWIDEQKGTK
jgi:hypothetical protein